MRKMNQMIFFDMELFLWVYVMIEVNIYAAVFWSLFRSFLPSLEFSIYLVSCPVHTMYLFFFSMYLSSFRVEVDEDKPMMNMSYYHINHAIYKI
jgi:hypothetical protein